MPTRAFTAKQYGHSDNVRSRCDQVQLRLFEDGRFALDALRYYKDWGDKTELRCTWEGTWSETDETLTCRSEHQLQVDRAADHDSGLSRHTCKRYAEARVFEFAKQGEDVLCPFAKSEFGGVFAGQPLRSDEEPHETLFKAIKAKPASGEAPVLGVDASASPAWA